MRSGRIPPNRPVAITGAVALAFALWGSPASTASASATPDAISVSSDGVSFAPTLPTGLFATLGTFIPGRSASARIWVRNDSSVAARLRVDAWIEDSTDASYTAALSIRATVADTEGANVGLGPQPSSCTPLVDDRLVGAGSVVPITFRLSMADVGGTTAQAASADAVLRFTMTEDAVPDPATDECPTGGATIPIVGGPGAAPASDHDLDVLAHTGVDPVVPIAAAAALLTGGLAAILRRRRRES
ncbi:LPXTG cell wall anchor domain-containing protein [Leifsonia sp. YIM 134122]|uniref:LPXTG cell wall anchor domain-containing protein n=1 Tax=Leifsonia stereocauli TaxID=3134136 RepID=A0ABU9W553_9MICO